MSRSIHWLRVSTCGCGMLAAAGLLLSGCAQQPAAPTPASQTAAPTQPPASAPASSASPAPAAPQSTTQAIDPGIIETLDRMGSYLRSLKSFELQTTSDTDVILANDQLVQFSRWSTLKVRRPDALRADIRDDGGDRKILYLDGKTATLFDPANKFYATVNAPGTIADTVKLLAQRYGIELPVADLFYWDSNKTDTSTIQSADFLGDAEIDGKTTTHFAVRQPGVDWQIWVERGASPLPRKLVITSTSDPARPQHSVLLRWNLSPKFGAGDFTFKAPPGAHRIVIQNADGKVETPGN